MTEVILQERQQAQRSRELAPVGKEQQPQVRPAQWRQTTIQLRHVLWGQAERLFLSTCFQAVIHQ